MTRRLHSGPLFGWSTEEAAELAAMDTKALASWAATGFLEPTVLVPDHGQTEPSYGLCDVAAAVMARQLLAAKVARSIVRVAVREVQLVDGHEHSVDCDPPADAGCHLSYREAANVGLWLLVPASKEIADLALEVSAEEGEDPPTMLRWMPADVVVEWQAAGKLTHEGELRWVTTGGDEDPHSILFPLSSTVAELVARVDGWRRAHGLRRSELDPWQ